MVFMTVSFWPITIWNVVLKWVGFMAILSIIYTAIPSLYPSFLPVAATATVLTAVGGVGDWTVLQWLGNLKALSIGWFGMTAIIWMVAWLWGGTHVSLGTAGWMALCLGPLEYSLHRWLMGVE